MVRTRVDWLVPSTAPNRWKESVYSLAISKTRIHSTGSCAVNSPEFSFCKSSKKLSHHRLPFLVGSFGRRHGNCLAVLCDFANSNLPCHRQPLTAKRPRLSRSCVTTRESVMNTAGPWHGDRLQCSSPPSVNVLPPPRGIDGVSKRP